MHSYIFYLHIIILIFIVVIEPNLNLILMLLQLVLNTNIFCLVILQKIDSICLKKDYSSNSFPVSDIVY